MGLSIGSVRIVVTIRTVRIVTVNIRRVISVGGLGVIGKVGDSAVTDISFVSRQILSKRRCCCGYGLTLKTDGGGTSRNRGFKPRSLQSNRPGAGSGTAGGVTGSLVNADMAAAPPLRGATFAYYHAP